MTKAGLGVLFVCLLGGCASAKAAATTPPAADGPPQAVAETPHEASNDPKLAVAAQPEQAEPIADSTWIDGAPASTFMLPNAHEELVGVWVDVPDQVATAHVPTALSLAIDTSGSMRGDKIVHAREAARRLIEQLHDGDMVSIVAFSDRAQPIVQPTVISPQTRRHALAVVEELSADGGTALHHGLATAQSLLARNQTDYLVRRAVVISDGKATVGPSDPDTLGSLAEHGMSRGVQVTSLGVGLDYDESTLDEMSIRSSGRLYHIAQAEELPAIIEQEMALLAATAAADAFVEIVPGPGVRLAGLDRARWSSTTSGIQVPLGAMFAGQQRELLVRAHVDAHTEGERPLLSVRLHFRDPQNAGIARVQERVVAATVTDDPTAVAEHEHTRTQTIIAMRQSAMLALAASKKANAGQLAGAEAELHRAEKQLRTRAKKTKSKPARARMLRQAERISGARSGLTAAKKDSGAGRARKSRATALDLNEAAMDAAGY